MGKPIIALDAGHGMNTPGKRCLKSLDPDQTREWYLNDRILDKVEENLKLYCDCTVIRVGDTTGKKDVSLSARVKAANAAGAAVYISQHHNAGLGGRRGGGTVVYWYSSKSEREAQARRLYEAVVYRTGLIGNRAGRVIKKNFYVLRNTKMAAFLIEGGFMDSPDDVPVILSEQHACLAAQGIIDFLTKEYNLQPRNSANEPQEPASCCYPAYTGEKTTLSIALQSLGINYTYGFRKKIAAANNITGYRGTAAHNIQMYNLLVAGILKKP